MVAVTTALCADRAAVAGPAARVARPQVSELASRLVSRLSQSFRRVVASALSAPLRRAAAGRTRQQRLCPAVAVVPHRPLSPFQFRLPPPTA